MPSAYSAEEDLGIPPPPKPSKTVETLLSSIKTKFNKATDLLVISGRDLEEALNFDSEGWLNSIAPNLIVLDDLRNVSIVRTGYGGGMF